MCLRADSPVDLRRTYGVIRRGPRDPTARWRDGTLWRALHTPLGPVTVRLDVDRAAAECRLEAWGAGADHAAEHARGWFGLDDAAADFAPPAGLVRDLARSVVGLRVLALRTVFDLAAATILDQRVTSIEGQAQWRALVFRHGTRAPGPVPTLWIAPTPRAVADLSEAERHALGVENSRGTTLARVAAAADRLEASADGAATLSARLRAIPGVGEWTANTVVHSVCGDEDAVAVGDYHLPSIVSFALTGTVRARDDAFMLELLEPYRPFRGRAARLLAAGGPRVPRRAPRMAIDGVLGREIDRSRRRR